MTCFAKSATFRNEELGTPFFISSSIHQNFHCIFEPAIKILNNKHSESLEQRKYKPTWNELAVSTVFMFSYYLPDALQPLCVCPPCGSRQLAGAGCVCGRPLAHYPQNHMGWGVGYHMSETPLNHESPVETDKPKRKKFSDRHEISQYVMPFAFWPNCISLF